MSDEREMTLLEAARFALWWFDTDGKIPFETTLAVKAELRAAIEREEQREWKMGDKAVLINAREYTGAQCVCITEPRVLVRINGAIEGGEWVSASQLRRPTEAELANWPGGEE